MIKLQRHDGKVEMTRCLHLRQAVIMLFLSLLVLCMSLSTSMNVQAAQTGDTDVQIIVVPNPGANMLYQCIFDGKPITKEADFRIIVVGKDGEKVELGSTWRTINGALTVKDMPYGDYILVTDWNGVHYEFPVTINQSYADTQDVVKYLDFGKSPSPTPVEPSVPQPQPQPEPGQPQPGDTINNITNVINQPQPSTVERTSTVYRDAPLEAEMAEPEESNIFEPPVRIEDETTPMAPGDNHHDIKISLGEGRVLHVCIWFILFMILFVCNLIYIIYRCVDRGTGKGKKEDEKTEEVSET